MRRARAAFRDLVLRPAREADLEGMARIERRCFSTPWAERTFRGLLRRPSTVVTAAEIRGRVVGYSVLWQAGAEAELGNLAVEPEFRRHGVGRALLGTVLERARQTNISALFLEVRESNEAARGLYDAYGFEVVGVREGYYASPREDALIMRLELDEVLR
ncbi:MAG: ribosomal protein S18-alanine N-acetyltransferase [Gemmatimonadota bacterium]